MANRGPEGGGALEGQGHHQDSPFHPGGGGGVTKSRDIYAFTFWSLTEATFDHVTFPMFICSAAPAVTTT